jgi:putative oxidoreductase
MKSLYATLDKCRPFILSIVRIVVGLLFLQHGLSKFFGFPVPGSPLVGLTILSAILETAGGLLLAAGAYTRIVAFILSGQMAFAYFMVHAPKSFYPLANGGESAILYCFIFFYFVFAGGGPLSVDRLIFKRD